MVPHQSSHVKRRRVFYIPGYDPIHPRRYRELYRSESREQAAISGYEIDLRPKKGHRYGWEIASRMYGQKVRTEMEVLVWSDIVRDSMSSSIPATYLQLIRTAWTYLSTGTLRRLAWMRKGPVIAALYPVAMLLAQLLLAIVAGSVAGGVVTGLLGWLGGAVAALFGAGTTGAIWQILGTLLWWAVCLPVGWLVLHWFKTQDGRFFAYYLMHDYAYTCQLGGANPPELEARMAQFTDAIAAAMTDEVDEVLVVGHSSGAHLGVSILADLVRQGRVPANGPALSFLTLGQVVPMVSFLPHADRLRADLNYLSAREELTWVDVTAPGDGCAFALCDPVAVTGVAPEGQLWPLVFSAAFTQSLSPAKWRSIKWRFFRLHFQYLCAFDRPKDYDYFQITAGPQTLGDRYEDRAPSRGRIDVPASRYTSMAA